MSIIQDRLSELRYIQRKNLDEEAKVIGNYYRDIIHSFGVDCKYYKLSTNYPVEFTDELSQNNLILHAYGYEADPNFSISAEMITYMEVESDIFNLNRYGIIPDMTVNFYFDSTDFAAALATKIGVLKEYEVYPENIKGCLSGGMLSSGENLSFDFENNILSGVGIIPVSSLFETLSSSEELSVGTISCYTGNVSNVKLTIPVNDVLYRSFGYKVLDSAPEEIAIYCHYSLHPARLDYGTSAITEEQFDLSKYLYGASQLSNIQEDTKYWIKGEILGTVLFHGLDKLSKYSEKIVPNVGDIITIDFPDEKSREQFQITEALDKNLSPDGQNPLLHKYYWKCKAKRYVNDHELFPEKNDANKQLDEKLDLINHATSDVTEKIEIYNDEEDKYYGGYGDDDIKDADGLSGKFDNFTDITDEKDIPNGQKIQLTDDMPTVEFFEFENGAKLRTDGYDLFFQPANSDNVLMVTTKEEETQEIFIPNPQDFQYLKATNDCLVFITLDGKHKRVYGTVPTGTNLTTILISLVNISSYIYGHDNQNNNIRLDGNGGGNFYKFSNCNTILLCIDNHLYCKLGSEDTPIELV